MSEKTEKPTIEEQCCESQPCCSVIAIVTLDDRGQIVLPKEIREKLNLKSGDKLAVTTLEKDSKTCCLTIVPAKEISDMLQKLLGNLMSNLQPSNIKEKDMTKGEEK